HSSRAQSRVPREPLGDHEADRQLGEPVDAACAFEHGLAGELEVADVLREERQALLQLDPRQVGAEAVVDARAERERSRGLALPGALRSCDVEAISSAGCWRSAVDVS